MFYEDDFVNGATKEREKEFQALTDSATEENARRNDIFFSLPQHLENISNKIDQERLSRLESEQRVLESAKQQVSIERRRFVINIVLSVISALAAIVAAVAAILSLS